MITSFQNSGLIPHRVYQFFYFKQLYYGIIEIRKLNIFKIIVAVEIMSTSIILKVSLCFSVIPLSRLSQIPSPLPSTPILLLQPPIYFLLMLVTFPKIL